MNAGSVSLLEGVVVAWLILSLGACVFGVGKKSTCAFDFDMCVVFSTYKGGLIQRAATGGIRERDQRQQSYRNLDSCGASSRDAVSFNVYIQIDITPPISLITH
jgi:hypothetical protein